jgi:hypothetical protein
MTKSWIPAYAGMTDEVAAASCAGDTPPTAAAAPGMRAQSRYCTVKVTGTGRRLFVRSLLLTQMSAE